MSFSFDWSTPTTASRNQGFAIDTHLQTRHVLRWALVGLAGLLWVGLVGLTGCDRRGDDEASKATVAQDAAPPPARDAAPSDRANHDAGDEAARDAGTDAASDSGGDASARAAVRPPLLWIVDGPHGPVYLFGTMHLGVSGAPDDLPISVRRAFEASTLFVMEADPRRVDERTMSSMLLLPPDESLDQKLSAPAWETLVDQLDAPPKMLRRMRPWVVETLLMEQALQREGFEAKSGRMDQQLFATAGESAKELGFLESWEAQVELMNEVMEARDVEMLADNPRKLDEMVRGLVEAYQANDAAALEAHLFDPELVDPTHYDRIFRRRNLRWLPRLRRWIARGDVFVAVGVGHLLGEHRLQTMLEARGYEVRRAEADTPDAPPSP